MDAKLSRWTQVKCKNCQLQNIVDTSVVHKDPANGELNTLTKYCTFCQHPLEVEENMFGVFCEYSLDCIHYLLKFIGTKEECNKWAKEHEQGTVSCHVEELTLGEFDK